ncbi:type II restriction endonuclease [Oleiphilus sp. HI0061]|uniref:type II restriction endonuclease n=1 Tax=Oleiphilus sp. HI0061 TaxID=1822239 RepID=UPI0007D02F67|nr:type II restriction endonuclease [Oleiphilus sp. HI0061]KZY62510.1 type II restriction endonuclease [Oleiphilus sp. HI0061]KZY62523.1 type II restriction endonuclease [Oleiphilus sp. HI0061]
MSSLFVHEEAEKFSVSTDSVIYKYIARKTKASDRDSKARRSLGNLYALYVLCDDYVKGNSKGSSFTELMARMKSMPFGSKLQNHPLDNRLNDEVRRQYGVSEDMFPVQPADLGNGKKARKISVSLLSEGGMNPIDVASYVVSSIDRYIQIIDDNQTAYLKEIEDTSSDKDTIGVIEKAFEYNSDARLFEIISFALLHLHFRQTLVTTIINDEQSTDHLCLYRTGRTNANDGGIDFVLKPLGKFFQVTETLDFKKYFLDFDKINRFSLSFVIKTDLSEADVRKEIEANAKKELKEDLVDLYISLFDEIYTVNELKEILTWVSQSHELISQLKEIVINCFKLEYGLLD